MYTCKGCGGYLKFDIESQSLKCESCNQKYKVPEEKEQNMEAEYTAKIYTCPQCGGELLGDDNEAVVFCSFCGSSNVLSERYQKERRPAKIIPFKITKEQCKEIYARELKSARFAPNELKDPKYIDSFRGIYMPFYLYDAEVNQKISVAGETVDRRGSTDHITDYLFTGNVGGNYQDIPHDASSSFADDISESIVPYRQEEAVDFSTGYMSGFYADTADVDQDIYIQDVKKVATEGVVSRIMSDQNLAGIDLKEDLRSHIDPQVKEASIGLFPVWFMSFRNKDRVAYAAINGQTGKMALDIPVDMKKYYLRTLIFAIPIFLILNFVVTMVPSTMLMTSIVFTVISLLTAMRTQKGLQRVISGANDRGLGKVEQKKKSVVPQIILLIVALVISVLVQGMNPVSDIPYYGAVLFSIIAVAITMASLAKVYNTISTRPLPQFKRRGGNDNA